MKHGAVRRRWRRHRSRYWTSIPANVCTLETPALLSRVAVPLHPHLQGQSDTCDTPVVQRKEAHHILVFGNPFRLGSSNRVSRLCYTERPIRPRKGAPVHRMRRTIHFVLRFVGSNSIFVRWTPYWAVAKVDSYPRACGRLCRLHIPLTADDTLVPMVAIKTAVAVRRHTKPTFCT